MEGILESCTYRTLHAHNFSRSSSQATLVLSDLLSRYFTLLTTSCAKYAQHAGRLNLTMQDALSALNEMGVNKEELEDYLKLEARELGRYAVQTARRYEDLREIKASMMDGIQHDSDDWIHLTYGRVPTPVSSESEDSEDEEEEGQPPLQLPEPMSIDRVEPPRPPITPPLPLSPVSNPASSPSRKRAKLPGWEPPSHIPEFLPPFPIPKDNSAPNSPEQPPPIELPPQRNVRSDKPLSPLPQVSTSTSSSDYLTPVPYSQSSLSTIPAWHLPGAPAAASTSQSNTVRIPTLQTQPALLGAYHHILTHPPPKTTSAANPSRHRVALSLLYQTDSTPRWEPADTLFSISTSNAPRVSSMPPSHPVPKNSDSDKTDHPGPVIQAIAPYPITNIERITPIMSQQGSRIPEAARTVLPPSVYLRATRQAHPGPLKRGAQTLTYGAGVNAPWNTTAQPQPVAKKEEKPALANGKTKEEPAPILPDSKLYATWDYETKSFKEPLVVGRKRFGNLQSSALSLKVKLGNVP